jgi:hypothetical protein
MWRGERFLMPMIRKKATINNLPAVSSQDVSLE